jgi:hypothetical protein
MIVSQTKTTATYEPDFAAYLIAGAYQAAILNNLTDRGAYVRYFISRGGKQC